MAVPEEEVVVKERPILFSASMVRAISDGRKTQTRRLVNPEPVREGKLLRWRPRRDVDINLTDHPDLAPQFSRYGVPKDRLWVREAFWNYNAPKEWKGSVIYRVDSPGLTESGGKRVVWKPGIHMPRWACRLILEVVAIRIERLQEITPSDAVAEGLVRINKGYRLDGYGLPGWEQSDCRFSPVDAYERVWNEINGERAPWSSNPFVWVVEFRRLS